MPRPITSPGRRIARSIRWVSRSWSITCRGSLAGGEPSAGIESRRMMLLGFM